MKPKVYIARKLEPAIVNYISEFCEVDMWPLEKQPVPRDVLQQKIAEVDGLYSLISDTVDEELLSHAPNLKVISNMAVGYNNIDVQAATARGIIVTNTPGVLTDTTADLTFALLMASARRVVEADNYLRSGDWHSWYPMQLTGRDIAGATIGIFGMGRIGEAVARRAKGFDMNILYHNRNRNEHAEERTGARYVSKEELLKEADYICILMPLTSETINFIAKDELALMKKTAILINTARGGIINEMDLYVALVNKQILAAGLDVFEQEPIEMNHPLLSLKNVVALPHIGSASVETRIKMATLAADNLIAVLTGNEPKFKVGL